jgi:hypothetical protein
VCSLPITITTAKSPFRRDDTAIKILGDITENKIGQIIVPATIPTYRPVSSSPIWLSSSSPRSLRSLSLAYERIPTSMWENKKHMKIPAYNSLIHLSLAGGKGTVG